MINIKKEQMSIHLNQINLNEKDIPVISASTQQIFRDLKISVPKSLDYALGKKVNSLLDIAKKLENAKEHEVKNKILGVLIPSIGVGLIAAGIFLGALAIAAFFSTFVVGFAVQALMAVNLIVTLYTIAACMVMAACIILSVTGFAGGLSIVNDCSPKYLHKPQSDKLESILKHTPYHTSYEAFKRVSWLENDLSIEKKEIEANFSKLCQFFQQDLDSLENQLEIEINNCKKLLEENAAKYSITVFKEIKSNKEKFEKALLELQQARQFYNTFSMKNEIENKL